MMVDLVNIELTNPNVFLCSLDVDRVDWCILVYTDPAYFVDWLCPWLEWELGGEIWGNRSQMLLLWYVLLCLKHDLFRPKVKIYKVITGHSLGFYLNLSLISQSLIIFWFFSVTKGKHLFLQYSIVLQFWLCQILELSVRRKEIYCSVVKQLYWKMHHCFQDCCSSQLFSTWSLWLE